MADAIAAVSAVETESVRRAKTRRCCRASRRASQPQMRSGTVDTINRRSRRNAIDITIDTEVFERREDWTMWLWRLTIAFVLDVGQSLVDQRCDPLQFFFVSIVKPAARRVIVRLHFDVVAKHGSVFCV